MVFIMLLEIPRVVLLLFRIEESCMFTHTVVIDDIFPRASDFFHEHGGMMPRKRDLPSVSLWDASTGGVTFFHAHREIEVNRG